MSEQRDKSQSEAEIRAEEKKRRESSSNNPCEEQAANVDIDHGAEVEFACVAERR